MEITKAVVASIVFALASLAQTVTPGGGSGGASCTGAASIGDVGTATGTGTNPPCTWQSVGGVSVTESAITNSEYVAVSGTNTLTGSTTTTYGSLSAGFTVRVLISATNSGAVTLNVNSVGARAVTKSGTSALTGGELVIGHLYLLVYDGTQFQIIATYTNGTVGQALTSDGLGGFSTPIPVTQSGAASSLVETDSGGNVIASAGIKAGASPPAITGSGIMGLGESTGQACPASAADCLIADSSSHRILIANNSASTSGPVVGASTTDTLTNKTFDTAGAGNSLLINGVAATANTGTGSVVRATSPALVTPNLGTPTALVLTNATALPCGATPALIGDTTTSAGNCATTTSKVNGTSVPTNAAADQFLGTTASATGAWASIPNCGDSSHALAYNTTTHLFSCQSVTGGASSPPVFPVNPQTTTYQTLASDFSNFKTITVASGTFTVTLVASGSQPSSGQGIWIVNYGSGVVTVARSGQNINGAAANLTLAAGSASAPTGAYVVSDGTNYFALVFGGGGGGVSSVTGSNGVGSTGGATPNISLSRTVNAQTGTTYTLAVSDCGNKVTFSNSSLSATATLNGSGTFSAGCEILMHNLQINGSTQGGIVEVDASGTTFLGTAQSTRFFLLPQSSATASFDGTNWVIEQRGPQILCAGWQNNTASMLSTDGGTYNTIVSTNAGASITAFAPSCTTPANFITSTTQIEAIFNILGTSSTTSPAGTLYTLKAGTTAVWTGTSNGSGTSKTNFQSQWRINIVGTAASGASATVDVNVTNVGGPTNSSANQTAPGTLATNGTLAWALNNTFSSSQALNMIQLRSVVYRVVQW